MTYKTELHCHTGNVSSCAHATENEVVEKYLEYGYSTLVTTEHINPWTFPRELEGDTWEARLQYFMNGYHKLVEASRGRLNILLGAEIRFMHGNNSDYLVFGLTEEFLRRLGDPRYINSIEVLSRCVRSEGMMIFQAHPFRPTMMVTDPRILDGIEVANCSPWHNSHNRIAMAWAKENNLIGTSGTDFHDPEHIPLGGITTEYEIRDSETLLKTLREGTFELIVPDSAL